MIPITVHVPERRVEEFYIRFGEFVAETPDSAEPVRLESGAVPSWVLADDAQEVASRFWSGVSLPGRSVLTFLSRSAKRDTVHFTPDQLASALNHPNGVSGIAGILGGVGKAIRRAQLPLYRTPKGGDWHYVWGWDGEKYSMTPEVAKLLRDAERAS
ncbi:hypothetical protein ACIP5T_10880 [Microbacterium sp. NPDC088619]|uniref:hypothetical protein n=1 Tax=Microbacterium sp. NPDC088619 TaxID=3364196 RepID=UPI003801288D